MLSLGIDPGMATIGYGLVQEMQDGSLQATAYGVITTPPELPSWERLKAIYEQITALIERHRPDHAAVEELFFARNVTTAITVAQGRGVILLALAEAGIPIAEYKPNFIKQAVSGYGGAKKPQMQEMVRILLGLEAIPRPDDAADALAVAITDIHSLRFAGLANE
ncbi:MAG: crossover junction endodeoxyribonuclease RuvC [Chloroflexota bacterium]|jgi:crossover junction endodeoxyribonuclease RuvC|nr:MAG: crossover junction endodeoxyribonuclease RuvC [Chloroflexota bacterium]